MHHKLLQMPPKTPVEIYIAIKMFIYLNNLINIGVLTHPNAVIAHLLSDKCVQWLRNSPLRVSSAFH